MSRQKGFHHSQETKDKQSKSLLKGRERGYWSHHQWIRRTLGRPTKCGNCGIENLLRKDGKNGIQWSNISGNYLRDILDWRPLCFICHYGLDRLARRLEKQHELTRKWANGENVKFKEVKK